MAGKRTNTRRMQQLRKEFFAKGKEQDTNGNPDANCWLCKTPIDYDVEPGTTPESHNLDHFYTVTDFPELQEDPTNFRHSHALCNGVRGKNTPSIGLGDPVTDWW